MNDIQDNERVLANENFWANLRDRPDYIKYEFAKSVEKLDLYLGESFKVKLNLQTSPRENNKQNHNFSEDDSGLGNFIESLYDFQNEAIKDLIDILNGVYYDLSERLESSAKYVWGILQGDFNDSPTISQVIISGLISVIPIADQVSDIRDLVANVLRLTDEGERENPENWINLALTAFGLIPMVGSVIKTLIKVIRHNEVTDIHHLTHLMETCETYLRKIGAGDYIPWKDSPIHWLQSKPWQELADRAKSKIKEYLRVFSNDLRGFGSANSVNHKNNPDYINFDKKLDDLAKIVEDISYNINQYIDKIALEVSTKVDELLSAPYAMAMVANGGKSTHTTYVNGKTPTSATHTQKSQKFTLKQMPQKRVGCFSRVNTDKAKKRAKQNIQNDHPPGSKNLTVDEYLDKETDWQLKLQQDGINSMTVEDYEKGRDLFRDQGRGNASDQRKAREDYEEYLLSRYTDEYTKAGLPDNEIKSKAKATTDNVMATLAALHNPDQIVGGANSNVGMDMGLKNVNSSIGSQWRYIPKDDTIDPFDQKLTRVDAIDKAVEKLPDKSTTRMNVKLERCK